jgi:hypothetical protein
MNLIEQWQFGVLSACPPYVIRVFQGFFLKMTPIYCEHMPSLPLNLANKTNNLALMR